MKETKLKLTWRVGDIPTGRWCSFETRDFPSAFYANGECAVMLRCSESYTAKSNIATDLEINIFIAFWKDGKFDWRKLKSPAASISEAKTRAVNFLISEKGQEVVHPNYKFITK